MLTLYINIMRSTLRSRAAYACVYMGLGPAGRTEGYMAAADATPRLDRIRLHIHPHHASCIQRQQHYRHYCRDWE